MLQYFEGKVVVAGTPHELANWLARVLADLVGDLYALVTRLIGHLNGLHSARAALDHSTT